MTIKKYTTFEISLNAIWKKKTITISGKEPLKKQYVTEINKKKKKNSEE